MSSCVFVYSVALLHKTIKAGIIKGNNENRGKKMTKEEEIAKVKEEEKKKKTQYKLKNWSEYNKALKKRGSVTLWVEEEELNKWKESQKTGKKGRPPVYSDELIKCMGIVRQVYKLAYRQTEGFMESIVELMGLEIAIPSYSQLCRRLRKLDVSLGRIAKEGKVHVVIDSTGLKVYGEGEWKVRKHKASKRRKWCKVHLAIDEETNEVLGWEVTGGHEGDAGQLENLLAQVEEEIEQVSADKGYDTGDCHRAIKQRNAKAVIPPKKNAVENPKKEHLVDRNEAVKRIREVGEEEWKIESNYHRRSLSETAMFRLKQIFGNRVGSVLEEAQKAEVGLRCLILNRMSKLGMPDSYPVIS